MALFALLLLGCQSSPTNCGLSNGVARPTAIDNTTEAAWVYTAERPFAETPADAMQQYSDAAAAVPRDDLMKLIRGDGESNDRDHRKFDPGRAKD